MGTCFIICISRNTTISSHIILIPNNFGEQNVVEFQTSIQNETVLDEIFYRNEKNEDIVLKYVFLSRKTQLVPKLFQYLIILGTKKLPNLNLRFRVKLFGFGSNFFIQLRKMETLQF